MTDCLSVTFKCTELQYGITYVPTVLQEKVAAGRQVAPPSPLPIRSWDNGCHLGASLPLLDLVGVEAVGFSDFWCPSGQRVRLSVCGAEREWRPFVVV